MSEEQPEQPHISIVTFSPEQQVKVDEIVKKAMGRSASETRQELEAEKRERARLDAELKTAQEVLNATATERDTERAARLAAEKIAVAQRRDAFISKACLDFGFVDAGIVASLTEGALDWNETTQSFDVIEQKATQSESDSEDDVDDDPPSVTPNEFFARFAAKRPYLVRSNIHSGAGSGDSSRTGLPTGRQEYKVEQIFGRGSSSQLANELARKDPAAYHRLKSEARNKKLI